MNLAGHQSRATTQSVNHGSGPNLYQTKQVQKQRANLEKKIFLTWLCDITVASKYVITFLVTNFTVFYKIIDVGL